MSILKDINGVTFFAPDDDAFKKLPPGTFDAWLKDKSKLTKILKHHVVKDKKIQAAELKPPQKLAMLDDVSATVVNEGGKVKIDGAAILKPDVPADNGVIHVLDTVIMVPPFDIVETVFMNGKFTTLLSALGKADLISTLKGAGPFTLFAPNDDAFAKLSKTELADLLKSENKDKLASILKYHVVSGKSILKSELKQGQQFGVLAGGNITVSINGTKTKINEATIIEPNGVSSDNGVIYTIDTVLTPKTNVASTTYAYQASLGFLLSTLVFLYHACL